jgi:hypothetical protein
MPSQLETAQLNKIRENLKRNANIIQDQLRDWFLKIYNGIQFKKFDFLANSKPKTK